MTKRKRSNRPPQLQHGKKSSPSQHDKRRRLCTPNPTRRKTETELASMPLLGRHCGLGSCHAIAVTCL